MKLRCKSTLGIYSLIAISKSSSFLNSTGGNISALFEYDKTKSTCRMALKYGIGLGVGTGLAIGGAISIRLLAIRYNLSMGHWFKSRNETKDQCCCAKMTPPTIPWKLVSACLTFQILIITGAGFGLWRAKKWEQEREKTSQKCANKRKVSVNSSFASSFMETDGIDRNCERSIRSAEGLDES